MNSTFALCLASSASIKPTATVLSLFLVSCAFNIYHIQPTTQYIFVKKILFFRSILTPTITGFGSKT